MNDINRHLFPDVKRGEIWYADLRPVVGSEQGGIRPILVIQNDVGNLHSPTVIVAAISSSKKKSAFPTHVFLTDDCGLLQESTVLAEQIRTIDRSRLREHIGQAGTKIMNNVDYALLISIGLNKKIEVLK